MLQKKNNKINTQVHEILQFFVLTKKIREKID